MPSGSKPILDQIAPFNEFRFDACMAYLSRRHSQSLTQYDMVKLHLMTDVFHTLKHAKPVIGGAIQAWKLGPVVPEAYNRIRHWTYKHEESGFQPEAMHISDRHGNSWEFTWSQEFDESEFSASEVEAMECAWNAFMHLDWSESQEYFHEKSFVGRAWAKAQSENRNLEWDEIIDEFDREHDTNHDHVKALIRF